MQQSRAKFLERAAKVLRALESRSTAADHLTLSFLLQLARREAEDELQAEEKRPAATPGKQPSRLSPIVTRFTDRRKGKPD
jgi:hypothetical protein